MEPPPPNELGARRVIVEVNNRSTINITDLTLRVTGVETECQFIHRIERIAAQESMTVTTVCRRSHQTPTIHEAWDLNQPLTLYVNFYAGYTWITHQFAIGYLNYYGWATSWDAEDGGVLYTLMAKQASPGLAPFVRSIRVRAEQLYGHDLDSSPESRVAVTRAITEFFLTSGVHYVLGGDAYQGRWPAAGTTNFPAETLAFGWGACDDFAVLANFFLHELNVPFATLSSSGHVASMVEIARNRRSRPHTQVAQGLSHLFIHASCDNERCLYLPLDLSQIRTAMTTYALLRESHVMWKQAFASPEGFVLVPSWRRNMVVPAGTMLGQSWLGSDAHVHVTLP